MRTAIDGVGVGVGVAVVAEDLTAKSIERGELERLLAEWTACFPGFHLCYSG